MRIWEKTDQGVIRKENQDACAANTFGVYTVAVVCDGMGGAKAGAVASSEATGIFMDALRHTLEESMTEEQIRQAGLDAAAQANAALYERSRAEDTCRGMGTTLVAAVCRKDRALLFNVGDSRCYLINAAGIRALTRDHSLVEDLLENGDITQEEARTHPNRNLITRAVGTERTVLCDTFDVTLLPGDHLLLCSDGLVNTVSDQEILYEVIHEEQKETCLDRMLEISIDRGAPDNVTMILLEYEEEAE